MTADPPDEDAPYDLETLEGEAPAFCRACGRHTEDNLWRWVNTPGCLAAPWPAQDMVCKCGNVLNWTPCGCKNCRYTEED